MVTSSGLYHAGLLALSLAEARNRQRRPEGGFNLRCSLSRPKAQALESKSIRVEVDLLIMP